MSSSQEATKAPSSNPSPEEEGRIAAVHPSSGVGRGGFWFITLFAAEEIPATIVTYVALLMLLQLQLAPAEATLLSAILFVPWVLKSFARSRFSGVGYIRQMLLLVEALLFAGLLLLAFSFNPPLFFTFHFSSLWSGTGRTLFTFLALLLVSMLCAWHGLAAQMYYERMLRPSFQRLFTVPKLAFSQVAVVFTYGALIFLVGTLQVYFRQMIRFSWSIGCYIAAGIFFMFVFYHMVCLRNPRAGERGARHGMGTQAREELRIAERIRRQPRWWLPVLTLFLLLLPQSLMFYARVLYLYDAHARGGLQCTMQEIGFAQGTVGVIAFSLGIAFGRLLVNRYSLQRLFWPMAICLVLSPFVYLGMTCRPPESLAMLCCGTMTAQLLFGLGIGACRHPISTISGTRYRYTINMLQIPLVSAAMIVPMAASGWMVERLGYHGFFLVDALSAPVCLALVCLLRRLKVGRA